MIRFPRNHQADETLARVMGAARRVRTRREPPALAPQDDELVDLPPELMPSKPAAIGKPAETQIASSTETEPPADDAPPLEETGLDPGMMLAGADSFDALLKT